MTTTTIPSTEVEKPSHVATIAVPSWSVKLLRVVLGAVFVAFALPKLIPGASPVEDLVVRTVDALSFGILPSHLALGAVAALEIFIGLTLITGRLLKLGLIAMLGACAGFFAPLVLFAGDLFGSGITLEAQYILKDLVLVAAAVVVGSVTFRGAIAR